MIIFTVLSLCFFRSRSVAIFNSNQK